MNSPVLKYMNMKLLKMEMTNKSKPRLNRVSNIQHNHFLLTSYMLLLSYHINVKLSRQNLKFGK